jgi:hypothetical protein
MIRDEKTGSRRREVWTPIAGVMVMYLKRNPLPPSEPLSLTSRLVVLAGRERTRPKLDPNRPDDTVNGTLTIVPLTTALAFT